MWANNILQINTFELRKLTAFPLKEIPTKKSEFSLRAGAQDNTPFQSELGQKLFLIPID